MPDDSRLRDHARRYGLTFRWRTARDGRHWHAEARTWKDGEHVAWFAATTAEGEQAALDLAIDYVLKGLQPPTGGSINLSNALREGKRH